MIEWRRVPWPLWAYALLTIGESLIVVFMTVSTPIAPLIFFIALMFVWTYFVLRGVRWLWIVTIAVNALGLAINLATGGGTLRGDLVGLISLALLLLPATRRFFGRGEAVPAT